MMPLAITESTFLFLISAMMSSCVITNAYFQKQQFYPSVVYIMKSNASMGIIYLQGFILVILIGKIISKIFFGQLRAAEIEHLIERSWYAVTETCLAFTLFRDDLSPKFVALFTLLLFLKCFHWLAEDRVDYMERSPNISLFFHIRVTSLLLILGSLDLAFVNLAYQSTLSKGASVQLVFGFEYAILSAIILNISMKYILHFCDSQTENPWEDKTIYLLYTELLMGFLKISLYFIFIFIMMKIHTFPLFAIRPMYLAIKGFKKALNDVIMSRRAIRNMNAFYPDATTQDIENSDNVCIICRENMLGNGTCKKLPCNHIFHTSCLRSWFQRQQTCPTCRMDILRANAAAAASVNNNNNNNNANANNNNRNNNNQNNNNNNNAANGQIHINPFLAVNPLFFQQFNQLLRQQQNNNNNNNNAAPVGSPGGGASSAANAAAAPAPGTNRADNGSNSTASTSNANNNQSSSNESNANSNTNTSNTANNNQNNNANANANNNFNGNFPQNLGPSTSGGTPITATIFPFLQSPPFAMPQIPVETLLQGFSDDELRYLEGQSRQQLEARIKCLMDVKTLVTAATLRLQQFNCVVLNCKSTNSVATQTETPQIFDYTDSSLNNNNVTVSGDYDPQFMANTTRMDINNASFFMNPRIGVSQDHSQQEYIRQLRLQRFCENPQSANMANTMDEDWPRRQRQNGQSSSTKGSTSSSSK